MKSTQLDLETVYESPLSPLHFEIERFGEDVAPTLKEKLFFEDLADIIDQVAADVIGDRARVKTFGSFAMGLSTHDSDLDLVICNVIRVHSNGYRIQQKGRAIKILYAVAKRLAYSNLLKLNHMQVVAQSRIPVLKIVTSDKAQIDLTVHNRSGVDAASYMKETLKDYPTIIPVILLLKCLLKQVGLDDVSTGGLGGYALTNMALTHCKGLRAMGRPDLDAGQLLIGFLEQFGRRFDMIRQAISSRHGSILKKKEIEKETLEWVRNTDGWQGRTNGKRLPFIEDPLTGRNLAMSTTRFSEVQWTFRRAHDRLMSCDPNDEMLPEILDVERAIHRRRKKRGRLLPVKWPLMEEGEVKQRTSEKIGTLKKQNQNASFKPRQHQRRSSKNVIGAYGLRAIRMLC